MEEERLDPFYELLNNDQITSPEDIWECRVIDIFYLLDMDREALESILKGLLEKKPINKGVQSNDEYKKYRFFDIYADYYNDENISVSIALIDEGYRNWNLADITIKQLFSIEKLNIKNVGIFTDKILAAHFNEYGY